MMSDEELKKQEGEERGRKGRRDAEKERKASKSKIKNRAGENIAEARRAGSKKVGEKRKSS